MMAGSAPHVRKNRRHWETQSAAYQTANRTQLNRWDHLGWGTWDIAEDDLGILGDVRGLDALEYGCGACQFGIKVVKRGAHLTGLDLSASQLQEGLRNMEETGATFPVVQADGERIPFRDGSFDLVFCDHGVMGFADPRSTVPEVARVLRPGGLFAFNGTTPWIWVAWGEDDEPATRTMRRDYFGMYRTQTKDPDWQTTEFQQPYGEWIRLFRSTGFQVEDLVELRAPEGATTTYDYVSADWARSFPGEHIWKVRKV